MLYIVLGLLIVLFLGCIFRYHKNSRVRYWKKSLGLAQHQEHFNALYKHVNGFTISREARRTEDALDYIYGEIDFTSFIAVLSLVQPNSNTVFYDLGSGIGKAVLASAMVYPVKKSVGVELLPPLHQCACNQKQQLATINKYEGAAQKIHFILGDFLATDLGEATLIFVNSSTLFGTTWERLCDTLNKLSQVQTIITTSKPLISTEFLPQITTEMQMSWGVVPVFIHYRKQFSTNQLENIE